MVRILRKNSIIGGVLFIWNPDEAQLEKARHWRDAIKGKLHGKTRP